MVDETSLPERMPNGAAAAALLAVGLGTSTFAMLVILTEISGGVGAALNLYDPVGPLSGKSTGAVLVWVVSWFVLHRRWRNQDVEFTKIWRWTLVLFALAFLGTFPPIFMAFGH